MVYIVTPAVPRCVFLIHLPLAGTPFSFIFDHVSSCTSLLTPQPRYVSTIHARPRPSNVSPLAAQAPARALYKEVRGQLSVATPHIALILLSFSFVSVLSFLCTFCTSYTLCAPVPRLGYGPRVQRLNTISRHNSCTVTLYTYPVQHTAGQGITYLKKFSLS